MTQGRGSALVAMVVLTLSMFSCEMSDAASFTVGDRSGWTLDMVRWPKGKHFRTGDTLVFNYSPAVHDVVAVNKSGYDACRASRGSTTYTSGRDQLQLVKGQNYYICSIPGHCQSGMKIAVFAA